MGFRTLRIKLYKLILLHDKKFQDERQNTQSKDKKMMINGCQNRLQDYIHTTT